MSLRRRLRELVFGPRRSPLVAPTIDDLWHEWADRWSTRPRNAEALEIAFYVGVIQAMKIVDRACQPDVSRRAREAFFDAWTGEAEAFFRTRTAESEG